MIDGRAWPCVRAEGDRCSWCCAVLILTVKLTAGDVDDGLLALDPRHWPLLSSGDERRGWMDLRNGGNAAARESTFQRPVVLRKREMDNEMKNEMRADALRAWIGGGQAQEPRESSGFRRVAQETNRA